MGSLDVDIHLGRRRESCETGWDSAGRKNVSNETGRGSRGQDRACTHREGFEKENGDKRQNGINNKPLPHCEHVNAGGLDFAGALERR